MDYVLIGADKRFEYLAKLLRKDGKQVFLCDTAKEASRYLDQAYCYVNAFSLPACEQAWLLSQIKEGSVVLGGQLLSDCSRIARGEITYRDLSCEEEFALRNALPTAEGCLERVLALTPFVVSGTEVLVVGFGRVGKETARLFRRCGANVTICVREGKSLEEAKKGSFPVFTPEAPPAKRPWRVIVNTVPKRNVVGASLVKGCQRLFLVLDLASGKGNVDPVPLEEQNVIWEIAGGLPGKCAPETAAFYYYQAIRKMGDRSDERKG